jgi:hypothetical protein
MRSLGHAVRQSTVRCSAMIETIKVGQRFQNRESLEVCCGWWYDTVAILSDDSDHCVARLPSGDDFTAR